MSKEVIRNDNKPELKRNNFLHSRTISNNSKVSDYPSYRQRPRPKNMLLIQKHDIDTKPQFLPNHYETLLKYT